MEQVEQAPDRLSNSLAELALVIAGNRATIDQLRAGRTDEATTQHLDTADDMVMSAERSLAAGKIFHALTLSMLTRSYLEALALGPDTAMLWTRILDFILAEDA